MSGCSERWTAAVVFFALFVCVASPHPAGPMPATGVLGALAEPDGSAVSLKAVSVQRTAGDPPHIVVSDPWAGDIRLIVLLPAPADVLRSQTVDVSGVLTTLPNGSAPWSMRL